MNDDTEKPNVNVVVSVWRRLKKDLKEAIIRDLQPRKDVKGGGDVKDHSKSTTSNTGNQRSH